MCACERLNDALAGRYVFSPKAEHTATMILTHGLGDTALGWTDAVQYFYGPQLPHFKFVLPVRARTPSLFVPAHTLTCEPADRAKPTSHLEHGHGHA